MDQAEDQPPAKRRRTIRGEVPVNSIPALATSFDTLLETEPAPEERNFDQLIEDILPQYLQLRLNLQNAAAEDDGHNRLRSLTRSELSSMIAAFSPSSSRFTPPLSLALRRLKVMRQRRRVALKETASIKLSQVGYVLEPLQAHPEEPILSATLDGLYNIQTTPFHNSFLARLQGESISSEPVLAEDWETHSPWMNLMADIREHYTLRNPDEEHPVESVSPITYTYLQRCHIRQVHELLELSFWPGIDITDSLDYSPEQCTVVAVYKRLVVGVAIMSSPQETYITYLAVKNGWDNAQIATSMLYHLIVLNPTKDITLHVSSNNPAMLLYNRFGFKAEEFVAGFYEAYLDPESPASKNALRLRLRHLDIPEEPTDTEG